MKVNEIFEQAIPEATSVEDLLGSVKNGRFTKDGSKLKIKDLFGCDSNKLTSLEHCPMHVHSFTCSYNKLKSLEHCPSSTRGDFYCNDNRLTSLEHCAMTIGGDFFCDHNNLTSLHDIHKQIKEINDFADFYHNPIKSSALGLLKIKKLKEVNLDNEEVQNIINKYLPEGDIIECQRELIEAGFEEYAKL